MTPLPTRSWIAIFPGAPRIKDMLATGTHVLIRVKDGVTLRRAGDFLPGGSCLATMPTRRRARARLSLAVDRLGNPAEGSQVRHHRRRASTGPVLRSQSPALVAQEHAAWVTAVELARAAARRAIIGSARSGAATASLPAPLITANRDRILAGPARCRITADRSRHRDRKTKGRPSFPAGGPRPATCTAAAEISICGTLAA